MRGSEFQFIKRHTGRQTGRRGSGFRLQGLLFRVLRHTGMGAGFF